MRRNFKPYIHGFTLTELAVVLAIVSLLLVFFLPTTTTMINLKKREITTEKLKVIETALANYVTINKRLPCPADGSSSVAGVTGIELRTPANAGYTVDCSATAGSPANNNQQTGVVPWITIGLSFSDILDGWDRQITYRVAFGLTRDSSLDMSACDTVGTAATTPADVDVSVANTVVNTNVCNTAVSCLGVGTNCSNPQKFLKNKGFTVIDAAGAVLMDPSNFSGAAYVLISHGDNAVGAFSNNRIYQTNPTKGVDGTLEAINHSNGNPVSSSSTTISPQFRDIPYSESTDAALYFDDLLIRPTLFSLIQRAQLGPRSH